VITKYPGRSLRPPRHPAVHLLCPLPDPFSSDRHSSLAGTNPVQWMDSMKESKRGTQEYDLIRLIAICVRSLCYNKICVPHTTRGLRYAEPPIILMARFWVCGICMFSVSSYGNAPISSHDRRISSCPARHRTFRCDAAR